jgi:lipopolysaccharide export system protein LptC
MPDLAVPVRSSLQRWASPGGRHDRLIRIARLALPLLIGILSAGLVFAPLAMRGEVSFVLAKDTVEVARERMRATAATYRGEDSKGQPFELKAGSAVQASSRDAVVKLSDLTASIALKDGPASLHADAGRYDMDREIVSVLGPVVFSSADGYRLETRDVAIGLKTRKLASGGPVDGKMPLGTFRADRIRADLGAHTVTLDGRVRLHIVQGRAR